METISINAEKNTYPSAKDARKDGKIPMICYGKDFEPVQLTTEYQNFRRALLKAGKSSIIKVQGAGKDMDVLIHEVQYHPITDKILHVDLRPVKADQKITTEIPLVFEGIEECGAVKLLQGTFVINKGQVHIECLPKDLVHHIIVDVSSLVDFSQSINVSDLKLPGGIRVLDAPEQSLAMVAAPRKEEVFETKPATPEAAAPGAEEKKEGGEKKA